MSLEAINDNSDYKVWRISRLRDYVEFLELRSEKEVKFAVSCQAVAH